MSTMTARIDAEAFAAGYLSCAAWLADVRLNGDDEGYEGHALLRAQLEAEGIDYRDGEAYAAFLLTQAGPDFGEALLPDVIDFVRANEADLIEAVEAGRDAEHLGHDFYLSRCGHGTGYWDRGLDELGDRLHRAAKVYGEAYVNAWPRLNEAGEVVGWNVEAY